MSKLDVSVMTAHLKGTGDFDFYKDHMVTVGDDGYLKFCTA